MGVVDHLAIREAVASDATALAACIDAAYAHYEERIPDLPLVSANCAEQIETNLVWVAEAEGAIVGALVLIPEDGFMRFANVAVHPDFRGAGLGSRLLDLAEFEAVGRGYTEMRLNTHVQMPDNARIYLRRGWVQSGVKGSTVSMTKKLDGSPAES
ncbi:MAG: GNAT family N-acetyltransferase [Acidobacteria bacterium]|nr:GNAT family N-acetyltransferase [Acidobacteriota bacterium]